MFWGVIGWRFFGNEVEAFPGCGDRFNFGYCSGGRTRGTALPEANPSPPVGCVTLVKACYGSYFMGDTGNHGVCRPPAESVTEDQLTAERPGGLQTPWFPVSPMK